MAKTLADKIKESRQIEVKVGDITFTARRATSEEMFAYYATNPDAPNGVSFAEICRKHVTGWTGVKESDLIDGGAADSVPFDKSVFDDVIGDNQEWWTYIATEVLRTAQERITKQAESKKK